jgi:maltodextrin utilization protein YvdJ
MLLFASMFLLKTEVFDLKKTLKNSTDEITDRVADQYAIFKTFHGTIRNRAV